jgi:putative SOS response-associated peptidase YedK
MRAIHDRMPVILDKIDIGLGSTAQRKLKPAPEDRRRMWLVSKRVNRTGTSDDDPTLISEVAA